MEKSEIVKRGKFFKIRADGCVIIDRVRLSYPHLDKPYRGEDAKPDDKGKYGVKAMLHKDTHEEAIDALFDLIDKMCKDLDVKKPPRDKIFIRDGEDTDDENMADWFLVSANESRQPTCRDRRTNKIEDKEEIAQTFYGGCWGAVMIRPWYQDNKFGRRVNAGLVSVQFLENDEPFGEGRVDDSDAFDAYEGDDGDDSGSSRRGRSSSRDDDDDNRSSRRGRSSSRDDGDSGSSRRGRSSSRDDDEGESRSSRRSTSRDEEEDTSSRRGRSSSRRGSSNSDDL